MPAGATVVDARGKWVTPGIVAGFSRIGLVEVDAVDATNDIQADTSPFSAAIDVAPAINPQATSIAVSRAAGVTRAVVSPATARSIFAGQGAVIDLGGDMEPITRARAFQLSSWARTAPATPAAAAPRRTRCCATRCARRATCGCRSARGGAGPRAVRPRRPRTCRKIPICCPARSGRDDVLLTRFDAAALVPVLQGRQLLLVHVERASDILQVLALKREFPNLRLVLVGATEGWRVAEQIAAARRAGDRQRAQRSAGELRAARRHPVQCRPDARGRGHGRDRHDQRRRGAPGAARRPNMPAISSRIGRVPGHTGLSWNEAFAAISSAPAEALGLGGEIGSLRPGRRGDVVIWDGDPLELATGVEAVWIDGVRQSLENRQTRLRDRYRQPQEGALPARLRSTVSCDDSVAASLWRPLAFVGTHLAHVASAARRARRAARRSAASSDSIRWFRSPPWAG